MTNTSLTIGVVGFNGLVGMELLKLLLTKENIRIICYKRESSGIVYKDDKTNLPPHPAQLENYNLQSARNCDFVFLCATSEFSRIEAPKIIENNKTVVIDNSSEFRYKNSVPLVIPEINGHILTQNNYQLISNPNCTTAILLMAIFPIYKQFGIKKIIVSTYQSVSGAGRDGLNQLMTEVSNYEHGDPEPINNYSLGYPILFNIIPKIDYVPPGQHCTFEELKVALETQKILEDSQIKISCTAVRVPVIRSHSLSVTLETVKNITKDSAINCLLTTKGVNILDDVTNNIYPMPTNTSFQHNVNVGRIRAPSGVFDNGIDIFICGDQLLKGASLNAFQIFELICKINFNESDMLDNNSVASAVKG
tara:strand:+ start:1466 stop:2557 length:1092 start_codon:yes stop_codon:yes gene_type:complete